MTEPVFRGLTWWCGDDVCDCTQPIIERRGGRDANGLWDWHRVWEGTFRSGATRAERAAQDAELRAACVRHGAPQDIA